MKRIPILALIAFALAALSAGDPSNFNFNRSPDAAEGRWVDSVFNALSERDRIGQLIMVRAHSDKDAAYEQSVADMVSQYKVGGLCFFQGNIEKQAELTNRYQALSDRLPLFISMDAEWGIGMRLKESAISYPRQLMLGAIQDNRYIYDMGLEIARQCKRLGVHISFSPVADINNNASNPVINDRSFGEDRNNVTAKCFEYMRGLQDGGVMACAKHFPGHGDTQTDSHHDLPLIAHSAERLDSLELHPFRVLAQYGVGSMIIAHLNVPAIDPRANRPTTLSHPTITGLLRRKMGFQGLIFTDAMEMKGVAKYFRPGMAELEALRAGNDMALLPGDVGAAVDAVQKSLADSTLDRDQINESVKRVLRAKYRLGLTSPQRVNLSNIRREMNTPEALMIKRRLIEQSLTLVRDRAKVVGFPHLEQMRIATLAIGDTNRTVFQQYCGFFAPLAHHNIPKNISPEQENALLDSLRRYDVVLVSTHDMSSRAALNYGLSEQEIKLIRRLGDSTKVCLAIFGNPYCLRYFDACPTVLEAYNEDPVTQEIAAQALFGALDLHGKLPVTASGEARYGQGITRHWPAHRMGYDLPESVGMNSDTLALMEPLVQELIGSGAAPGAQILVVKDGKVVWHKAYGHLTYEKKQAIDLDNLFDMASVTKVAASTISTMRLYDEGKLDLKKPLQQYLPELANTNKKDLTLEQLLVHHAGLQAWIPFYESTLTPQKQPLPSIYRRAPEPGFSVPVAPNLYMSDAWVDTMWQTIFKSELRPKKDYKYSDLGLFLTARTIQRQSGKTLDVFADEQFYKPMGLGTTTYNPWKKGLMSRCVPTEEDDYFRYQRLQGYVHDMGAAMLGGVSGHAGLFSNANDLAKIFQMILNKGAYFDRQYIKKETVELFLTRYPASSRRGIGFDMKELDMRASQNITWEAGGNTFGHTGFTGNAVWADPDQKLIFVFLSNRTYPSMKNNKLISGDYRPRLQSIVYRSLKKIQ